MRSAFLAAILATGLHSQNFVGQIHVRPLLPPLMQPNPPAPVVKSIPRPTPLATCAIPLLNVLPGDANPDPRMIVQPKVTSHMRVVVPPAPPCQR